MTKKEIAARLRELTRYTVDAYEDDGSAPYVERRVESWGDYVAWDDIETLIGKIEGDE